jgi:drug/metabolite transporter (DMT)-like permease
MQRTDLSDLAAFVSVATHRSFRRAAVELHVSPLGPQPRHPRRRGAFSSLTLLPIGSALFYALAAIVTRARCGGERPLVLSLTLNISLFAAGALATGVIAVWEPSASLTAAFPFLLGPWAPMGAREWGIVGLLAVLMVGVSAGVAKAYQSGPPAIIATFDYAYLVFAAFWSLLFFSELPDAVTIAGMLLIAGGGLLAIREPASARRTLAVD